MNKTDSINLQADFWLILLSRFAWRMYKVLCLRSMRTFTNTPPLPPWRRQWNGAHHTPTPAPPLECDFILFLCGWTKEKKRKKEKRRWTEAHKWKIPHVVVFIWVIWSELHRWKGIWLTFEVHDQEENWSEKQRTLRLLGEFSPRRSSWVCWTHNHKHIVFSLLEPGP